MALWPITSTCCPAQSRTTSARKDAHPVDAVAVALAARVRHVDPLQPLLVELRDGHPVELAVIALAQACVGVHGDVGAAERELGGLDRTTEVGHEDDVDTRGAVHPNSAARRRPSSESAPSNHPVATPRSLSTLIECVSKTRSTATLGIVFSASPVRAAARLAPDRAGGRRHRASTRRRPGPTCRGGRARGARRSARAEATSSPSASASSAEPRSSFHGRVSSTRRFVASTRSRTTPTARRKSKSRRAASISARRGPSASSRGRRGGRRAVGQSVHHRRDAVDEVADAVREILVGPRDHPLDGEVGVDGAGHVAQQPPAQRVGADLVDDRDRVDRVAGRLGELLASCGEIRDARRSSWAASSPADSSIAGQYTAWNRTMPLPITWMRSSDVAPPRVERVAVGPVVERGDVVPERVPPHVDHLRRIVGHGDAPAACARLRARHADVVEPAGEERQHLVAVGLGHDLERRRPR